MRTFLIRSMVVVLLLLGLAGATSLVDEKLPTDPALVTGTLPNGLTYIIRPHRNPEGRVSIWLHVASGSLNETDSTRGLAHYLEHMAFNGSANFAPGSVVPFFQSLGLAFGRDQNAFTSFDQTTYQLTLPGGERDILEKGMLFMADVAMRLSLDPTEIAGERQIILEEKRARSSGCRTRSTTSQPGRARAQYSHDQDPPRGQAARLQHRRLFRARPCLSRVRILRGDRPTDPGKAPALAAAVEEMYAVFAKHGPTPEELTVAKKQITNLLDEMLKTPEFWQNRLSTLDYRGVSLDDLLDAPAQYQQFTGRDIREAFARYDRPEARFRFVITPRS